MASKGVAGAENNWKSTGFQIGVADFRELDRWGRGERLAAGKDEQGEEGQEDVRSDALRRIIEAATRPTVSKKQAVGSGMVVDCVAMPPEPETARKVISPVV